MLYQRGRYTSFPMNEKMAKKNKKMKRRAVFDTIIFGLTAFIGGIFTACVVLTYYPMPWW